MSCVLNQVSPVIFRGQITDQTNERLSQVKLVQPGNNVNEIAHCSDRSEHYRLSFAGVMMICAKIFMRVSVTLNMLAVIFLNMIRVLSLHKIFQN